MDIVVGGASVQLALVNFIPIYDAVFVSVLSFLEWPRLGLKVVRVHFAFVNVGYYYVDMKKCRAMEGDGLNTRCP